MDSDKAWFEQNCDVASAHRDRIDYLREVCKDIRDERDMVKKFVVADDMMLEETFKADDSQLKLKLYSESYRSHRRLYHGSPR